ncbi:branched-chain amino acid ABC transporter permease [Pelagibacterium lacus]|uniref:Branched-chain amino acid ABC transporter permease n=1 Tax=Pelagibacterium lacus TaxID=2282655 RepID=A0A369W748_9HYPH|nr:branched-chain amino acid ABC transporter permease [Pelagibacterium lacus]RDE10524.1 branched-chain amino acid ABC transporter permease [Pelagibacterium lacus]
MATYIIGILVTVSLFAILAMSLDLLLGYTGLFTISHAAIFGIGAYGAALTMQAFGWGFLPAVGVALGASALVSAAISLPSLRVSGDYLVLASFAIQEVFYSLLVNLDGITGGSAGLHRIPQPSILGFTLTRPLDFLIAYTLIAVLIFIALSVLVRSPFGLLLKAIREDEIVPQTLGKDVVAAKVKIFVIAGCVAGLAGALYGSYYTFIDPLTFDVHASVLILSMVLIGGMGTLWGPVAGAALLIILPELLRFFPFPSEVLGNLRQIFYGLIIIGFCFLRPTGLVRAR